jgi:nucleoside-diphosphate-sugar epimerase
MRVLVTGGTGFVGGYTVRALLDAGHHVRLAVRTASAANGTSDGVCVGDLAGSPDWRPALEGMDAVVHLAARVHVMRDGAADPMAEYRRVNVHGTTRLAEAAAAAGLCRFVFVSSIKVNGERTHSRPFTNADSPSPTDPYAVSKWEGEQALRAVCQGSGMEWVVVRPTLVYGAGAQGNLPRLISLVRRGVPLPFAGVSNRRSMIGVRNLAHLLTACVEREDLAGTVCLAADTTVSTSELLQAIGRAAGRPARLVPAPLGMLRMAGAIPAARALLDRLAGSLEVDLACARRVAGALPADFESEIAATVDASLPPGGRS